MTVLAEATRALRAGPTLLKVGLASAVAYRSEMLVWILTTNMPLVMLALWRSVARDGPVGRYGEAEFAAYFLVALMVRLLTSAWVVWEMNFEVRTGALATRLLRPIHPFVSYAADNLGALPLRMLFVLPVPIVIAAWLGVGVFTRDPVQWAIVPLSVIGAWALTFSVMAMIGTLALFWESSMSLLDLWLGFFFVFSGYLLPLDLFPPRLFAVVHWLPFRFLMSFPVENLLGIGGRRGSLVALGVQWGYVAACLVGAQLLWKRGLARFGAFGG